MRKGYPKTMSPTPENFLALAVLLLLLGIGLALLDRKPKSAEVKPSREHDDNVERARQSAFLNSSEFYYPPQAPAHDPDEKYCLRAFGSTAIPDGVSMEEVERRIGCEKEKDGIKA